MSVPAERLVRRYYLYGGLYTLAASIIWGINTLFLLDAGLSIGGRLESGDHGQKR